MADSPFARFELPRLGVALMNRGASQCGHVPAAPDSYPHTTHSKALTGGGENLASVDISALPSGVREGRSLWPSARGLQGFTKLLVGGARSVARQSIESSPRDTLRFGARGNRAREQ